MFKFEGKKTIIALFPFLILFLAWMLAMGTLVSYNKLNVIFITLPYILAFFALVLCVWFQHSRVFYAVAVLLFTMSVISSKNGLNQKALVNGISLLIPVCDKQFSLKNIQRIKCFNKQCSSFRFFSLCTTPCQPPQ
jgi:glucan phosphoethanolaminetransferase (alkaline phosphatase superfamily)